MSPRIPSIYRRTLRSGVSRCPSTPHRRRSEPLDLITSVVPYLAISVLMYLVVGGSPLLTLALAPVSAVFLLRTYIIFHDCSHGSFVASTHAATAWLGTFCGFPGADAVSALASRPRGPSRHLRRPRPARRRRPSDADRNGVLRAYLARATRLPALPQPRRHVRRGSRVRDDRRAADRGAQRPTADAQECDLDRRRLGRGRCRPDLADGDRQPAARLGTWRAARRCRGNLAVLRPAPVRGRLLGAGEEWSYADAALRGSSFLNLPAPLRFATGNIGYHHIHHLSVRIPNYNLQRAHEENPVFHSVPELSLWDGLRAVRLKLWDERTARLVTFAQARTCVV